MASKRPIVGFVVLCALTLVSTTALAQNGPSRGLTDAEIDAAIAWGASAGDSFDWPVCVDRRGAVTTLNAVLDHLRDAQLTACFSGSWIRVATVAEERNRHYNTLKRDDPFLRELLTPTLRVSTTFRRIGIRELGWSMRGINVEDIVLLAPDREPIHGLNFGQEPLQSRTVEDIRIDTIIAEENFPIASFPTGEFDVAFVLTGGEQRVHLSSETRRRLLPLK